MPATNGFEIDPIPSRETCLTLMEQHGMLPNIKAHSLQVARIAVCLGKNLLAHFPEINIDLVEAGALLHDIAKTECLKTKGNHAALGETMVRNMGFNSVARIVAQHVLLEKGYFINGLMDEVILVHYADKRVVHEEVVDLEERFKYLIKTYGRSKEAVDRLEILYQESLKMEKMIFMHLPFPSARLKNQLEIC